MPRETTIKVSSEEKQMIDDAREELGWPDDVSYGTVIEEIFGVYLEENGDS